MNKYLDHQNRRQSTPLVQLSIKALGFDASGTGMGHALIRSINTGELKAMVISRPHILSVFLILTAVLQVASAEGSQCIEALVDDASTQSLYARLAKFEPKIYTAIQDKVIFESPSTEFYDQNTNAKHNMGSEQEDPMGFDLVTMFRGLNYVDINDLTQNNLIEENQAIWLTPEMGHAGHYAAGNLRLHKHAKYRLVAKLKVPRFLVHWSPKSLRLIDRKEMTKEELRAALYGNTVVNEVAEAYLDSERINDWRNFIVGVTKVTEVYTYKPSFYTDSTELVFEDVETQDLEQARGLWQN